MKRKVFVIGDSSCADLAGAKMPKPENPFGSKKIIIDDLEITFAWHGGISAYSMNRDKYQEIIDNLNLSIDQESLVILFFGGIDFDVYLPIKGNVDFTVDQYFGISYYFFKEITQNVLYIETVPPCRYFVHQIKDGYPIASFKDRLKSYYDFNKHLTMNCLEHDLPKPFSIAKETLLIDEKIHKVHTPDGMHFYKNISELARLDLVKWIKKNKYNYLGTPKRAWTYYGSNDPWES